MRQYETCREWLESYRELRFEVQRLRGRHAMLIEQATNVVAKLSLSPRGGGGDKEQVLAALADASEEADRRLAEAEAQERELEQFIDGIDSSSSRIILRARYLSVQNWHTVRRTLAKAGLKYTEDHIYRLHRQAMKEAEEKWRSLYTR